MKGGNFRSVAFKIREVEMIWQRLLLPGKPVKLGMNPVNAMTRCSYTLQQQLIRVFIMCVSI
jgi:hypothetical protein